MRLQSPWMCLLALAFMLLAIVIGAGIRRRWPEHHTNRETIELLQTTVMMLATFAAIVLGLLINSAKSNFDDLQDDIRTFSSTLVQLDYSLKDLGPKAVPARQDLARYVAAAIAAVWRQQPPPPGHYYPRLPRVRMPDIRTNVPILGQMLEQVNSEVSTLSGQTPAQTQTQKSAARLMEIAISERWRIVEAEMGSLSTPFFAVLVFWTVLIYLCLGLCAPLNHVNILAMTLSSVALSSALFVIVDLYNPFAGVFMVDSGPMRNALEEMLHMPDGQPSGDQSLPFAQAFVINV